MRSVLRYKRKWMVVLNKIDLLKPRQLLPLIAAYATAPDVGPVVPVSARAGDGFCNSSKRSDCGSRKSKRNLQRMN